MKKKYWIILLIIIFVVIGIFFYKNRVKNSKIGNNKNSQEIVDYILNISSYEVNVTVNVTSNKNSNKYILKQTYQYPNKSTQEVIEPSNIAGVKIENNGESTKIENSQLDLSTILDNYNYLGNNCLDLYNFINKYKSEQNSIFEENEQEIKLKIKSNNNKYQENEILYINREKIIPTKLLVQDNNNNITIIIEYNEIELN